MCKEINNFYDNINDIYFTIFDVHANLFTRDSSQNGSARPIFKPNIPLILKGEDIMANKTSYGRHWAIAVLSFLLVFFAVGAIVTAYSTTSYYVMEEWGINNTQNGIMITVRTLAAVAAMYFAQFYYKKLSLKIGLPVSLIMGALGYAIFAVANNLSLGLVAMVVLGLSHGLAGMYAVTLLVNRWFIKRKGLVLGVVTTGSGFTTMIFPPLLVKLVESFSLSLTFWAVAVMFAVLAVVAFFVVANYPEDIGLTAMGAGEALEAKKVRAVSDKFAPAKSHLVLMLVTAFIIGPVCYSQGQFRTLVFTSNGWSVAAAAAATSTYGLMVIIGKLIYGPVTDRWSFRKCTVPFFLILAVSHVMLSLSGAVWFNQFFATIANVLYGLGGPVCTIGLALYSIEMAPEGQSEKWASYYLVAYNVGALIFNQLCGVMADAAGNNYNAVFMMFAALCVVAAITSQLAYSGAYKRYKKLNKEN